MLVKKKKTGRERNKERKESVRVCVQITSYALFYIKHFLFLYMFKGSFLHQNPSEPGSSHTDDKARLEAVLRGDLNKESLILVATKSKMFQRTRF